MQTQFHRIKRLPPYVFAEVNAMKAAARAAGSDIIDFGMGNPDLSTPPHIVEKLVEAVIQAGTKQPGGLPDCTWRPGSSLRGFAPTCTNESQYECVQGPSQGRCSHFNWFDKPEECAASCVHTSLLKPAPYYALWY